MSTIFDEKERLRRQVRPLRRAEPDRDRQSRAIFSRLRSLPEWNSAGSILYYVGIRDEVPTREALDKDLGNSRQVAVPWCSGNELRLSRVTAVDQLVPAAYGIPEPAEELRNSAALVPPSDIDVALVPGLVFDVRGNRLGYGRGYFDRLLAMLRPDCLKIGLAFDCQIVEAVPSEAHDRPVDLIVTPTRILGRLP